MEKILKIHPDALYDSEYIDYVLETDDFAAPELALKGEYKHENGVTVITTSGREIIIENCFENTLRLRITQPGACVDKTVTERLGLIKTDFAPAPYDYELKDGVITFSCLGSGLAGLGLRKMLTASTTTMPITATMKMGIRIFQRLEVSRSCSDDFSYCAINLPS